MIFYLTLIAVLHVFLDCCWQTLVDCFLFLPDDFAESHLHCFFLKEIQNRAPYFFMFSPCGMCACVSFCHHSKM